MAKKAMITGITGQDGFYLAAYLLSLDYEVYGIVRRNSRRSFGTLDFFPEHLLSQVKLMYGDVTDLRGMEQCVSVIVPDEVYHLASVSSVGLSWQMAHEVLETNIRGTLNVLASTLRAAPKAKVFVPSSGCVFGNNDRRQQNESTPLNPTNPYGTSKVAAMNLAANFRDCQDLFVSCGILFNHESPLRSLDFVTKKICRQAALIKHGLAAELQLGNTEVHRDWGFAGDYVKAMHSMLQLDEPGDFVVATGQAHTVADFARDAFAYVGLDYREYLKPTEALARRGDIAYLCGDAFKLRASTGWEPAVSYSGLVQLLMNEEMVFAQARRRELDLRREQEALMAPVAEPEEPSEDVAEVPAVLPDPIPSTEESKAE